MKLVLENFKIIDLDINREEIYSESSKTSILNQPSLFEFNPNINRISNLRFTGEDTNGSIMFKKSILDLFNINNSEKYEVTLSFFIKRTSKSYFNLI
jgi:hypothetical protein